MSKNITFDQAAQYGFTFPGARDWIAKDRLNQLARDAALITTPNTSVPVELLAYIDPRVVEILTAPRRAREVFSESRKGDWTTPYAKWRVDEMTGRTQGYSDFADNGVSDVNSNWKARQQYVFQTTIQYGDLETAMSGVARINLAASKQAAASTILDIDANRFYLLGVEGREIYGILNDPDLPPSITPLPGGGGGLAWSGKTTVEKYNDVLALFRQLALQSAGLIDRNTSIILLLSPEMEVELGAATNFNVSVLDMINKYFASIKIVALPELSSATAGQTMIMIAPEVAGQRTAELGFGEKVRAGRVVLELSSMKQKWVSSTYGGIVLQPFAFASMLGI
ncbi:DUF2184 domain-containing protein [Desulfovibrio sp. OttesenSCG-928-A18]|nr:DUF2184 domain-containing protein [Desulfovibrio sp. OttesenSCG-928-A18]